VSEDMIELLAVALYNQEYPDASDRNPNWPTWETHPETGRAASLCYEEHSREDFRDQAKAVLAAIGIPASVLASLRAGTHVVVSVEDKARLDRARRTDALLREQLDNDSRRWEAEYAARLQYGPGTAAAQPRRDEGNGDG